MPKFDFNVDFGILRFDAISDLWFTMFELLNVVLFDIRTLWTRLILGTWVQRDANSGFRAKVLGFIVCGFGFRA